MKLSENHIQELYKLTKRQNVQHFDVQTELVDHLANTIEKIWKKSPGMSFESARYNAFKKFGVSGFEKVVEAKQKQMKRRYYKTVFRFAKEWFRLPKIILTILIVVGFYQLQQLPNGLNIYRTIFGIIYGLTFFIFFKNSFKAKKQLKRTSKKWMFNEVIQYQGLANVAMFYYYFHLFILQNGTKEFLLMGGFRRAFSAIIISTIVILSYITLFVIPKKATQLLEETYPEYKLV